MMDFIKSKRMKISLNKNDQAQLSSPGKIQQALDEGQAFAFDICAGETVIGFAMLRPFDEHTFFLWDYAIDTAWQGKGYGEAALRELIELLKQDYQTKRLEITYRFGNLRAKRLYEKIGFQETAVIDQNGIHEVDMELYLG